MRRINRDIASQGKRTYIYLIARRPNRTRKTLCRSGPHRGFRPERQTPQIRHRHHGERGLFPMRQGHHALKNLACAPEPIASADRWRLYQGSKVGLRRQNI